VTRKRIVKSVGIPALIILPLIVPFFGRYLSYVLIIAFINILLAASFRLSFYVGLLNFGIVGFMAIGAYISGLLITKLGVPFLVSFVAAGLGAAIAGLIVGYPSLRVRSVYFLLLTWGFSEVIRSVAFKWEPVTGGAAGFVAPPMSIGGWELSGALEYYFILAITASILSILYCLEKSRLGLTWKAISQEESLAESVGVSTYVFRLADFAISCFVAGLAGSVFAHSLTLVTPVLFTFEITLFICIACFAGGIGHFAGPIIGVLVLSLLREPLRGLAVHQSLVYAGAVIVAILFLPEGLISLPQRLAALARRFMRGGES
jgi:branched-chain amino acid transport system permease protein